MPTLESNKVDGMLRNKMKAQCLSSVDWRYIVRNEQGKQVCETRISKGAKHTLSAGRVSLMARQLGLDTTKQLVELVDCKLSRKDALRIIEANNLPDISHHRD